MKLLEQIFSIKNNETKTRKIITIMGVKIKFKTHRSLNLKNIETNDFGISKNSFDVVILGNGPSLKDTFLDSDDYKFIKDKDIFVVNSFVQSEYFFELKPKFLCLMDPIYWGTTPSNNIKALIEADYEKLKNVSWNLFVFMPNAALDNNVFKDLLKINSYIKFIYINTNTVETQDMDLLYSLYKQNKAMPTVQNVLVSCLYCAINIGYKNIFVYGADHSWHLSLIVNENNIPCIIDKHFYDKSETIQYTPIYKDVSQTTPFKISELFQAYSIAHNQYNILEDYSNYMGTKIYNLSKFSCIDAFERKYDKKERINNAK